MSSRRTPVAVLTAFLAIVPLTIAGVAGCGHGSTSGSANSDVKVTSVTHRSDGKVVAAITITNSTSDKHNYSVQIKFEENGTTMDVATKIVNDVAGKGTAEATVTSNRSLAANTTAGVLSASRY